MKDIYQHIYNVCLAQNAATTEAEKAVCDLFRPQAERDARRRPNFVELSQPKETD